jgi:hypothetical protein
MKVLVGLLQRACEFGAIAPAMSLSLACSGSARADDVVSAVWKKQEISFVYRGGASAHTCGGLRTQLRNLLLALGAHETTTVTTVKCDHAAPAQKIAIVIASPFDAASQNLAAMAAPDSRRVLVARVRGEDLEATPPTFPARWRTISFANAMRLRLSPGDCEVLRQLQRDVMPRLSVRVLRDRMRCQGDLGSGQRPQLVVAALIAAPEGDP